MAKKTEIQYVIDAVTGSAFGKTMRTVNKELTGLRMARAEMGAGSRKAARGMAVMGGGMLRTALGAAAAYVGITQLVSGYKSVTGAANEQIRAETRLNTLMGNVKGTTLDDIKAVKQQAAALQKVTTVGDEVTIAGASQLASFQLQAKTIQALLPSIKDLEVATYGVNVSQEQSIQTANLIGKVMGGNVGALTRVGVAFTKQQAKILKTGTEAEKTATLIKVLGQNYGGLAQASAGDPGGVVQMLANAWGDVKEAIGNRLMPVQKKAMGFLFESLPAISALINKAFGGIDKIAAGLKGAGLGKIFLPLLKALPSIAGGLLRVFKPIIGFIAGKLLPFVKKVAADVIGLFLEIWPKVQPALVQLGGAIGKLLTAIMPILKAIWAVAKPILKFVLGTVLPIVIKGISLLIRLIAGIVTGLISAVKWVGNLFAGFWKIAKLLFKWTPLGAMIQAGKLIGKVVAGKRASGGPVSAGRGYLVGEKGPEWFSPWKSGFVSPTPALAGAGGGGGIHIGNVTIQVQGGSPAQAREAGNQAGRGFIEQLKRYERDRDRRAFTDR
ncbi:MAG TPA: hypothetical protein VFI02_22050 [Armatimonadota bacterium]|nr:hypothetical protein [Armatimonadota bacterium]